jgi:hypothetical protein
MLASITLLVGAMASGVLGQITLTPSSVRGGGGVVTVTEYEFDTITETRTKTESYIREITTTRLATTTIPPQTVTRTVTQPPVTTTTIIYNTISRTTTVTTTRVSTATVTQTLVRESTVTRCEGGGAACPTITQTATACRSCLVPQCTTTQALTRPCGCNGALPTAVVSFPCDRSDSCQKIGCTTVYSIQTARC